MLKAKTQIRLVYGFPTYPQKKKTKKTRGIGNRRHKGHYSSLTIQQETQKPKTKRPKTIPLKKKSKEKKFLIYLYQLLLFFSPWNLRPTYFLFWPDHIDWRVPRMNTRNMSDPRATGCKREKKKFQAGWNWRKALASNPSFIPWLQHFTVRGIRNSNPKA